MTLPALLIASDAAPSVGCALPPRTRASFELAPGGLLHRPIGQPLPDNRVVRDSRERIAVAVQQTSFNAGGVQHRDGDQRAVSDERADLGGQSDRHHADRPAQWESDFGALIHSGRQLKVPAGIVATGPTAKRDVVPGQPRVGSVEIRGVQLRLHRLAHRGRGTRQIRQERARVSIELTLNLAVTTHQHSLVSIRLITDDVARLVDFYEKVSGTPVRWSTPDFAEVQTPAGTLAIASTRTVALFRAGSARAADNHTAIIEFGVDDVDTELERIRQITTEFVIAPTTMPWGNRSLLFRDPDGNLINFFTPATTEAKAKFGR